MTVGELRKALEGVPDDMPVVSYDEGVLTHDVGASIEHFAPVPRRGTIERMIGKYSGHPEGTVGVQYFLVG